MSWVAYTRSFSKNKQDYVNRAEQYRVKLYEWYIELKSEQCCSICGEDKHWRLDYHHRDPSTKSDGVSQMIGKGKSKEKIINEMKKCDILCKNCHADVHYYGDMGELEIPHPS